MGNRYRDSPDPQWTIIARYSNGEIFRDVIDWPCEPPRKIVAQYLVNVMPLSTALTPSKTTEPEAILAWYGYAIEKVFWSRPDEPGWGASEGAAKR